MNTNNKCGWIDWFDLANQTLMAKMNISAEKTLINARNILVDKDARIHEASKSAGYY